MLESGIGERITTAALAREVGVSEAALYRHFPSKYKMFEGLIDFIEESVFTRVNRIVDSEASALAQLERIVHLVLAFAERNPGMSRILTGDALVGENQRLRSRVAGFYDRLETQVKQVLREAEVREGLRPNATVSVAANLLIALAEGRICQFVRSGFTRRPTEHFDDQWLMLIEGFLRPAAPASATMAEHTGVA